jgi:single-strand DNA-binding protein
MNVVCIIGRLTRDIELKSSTSGTSYLQNSIAVDRKGKEKETDFFNVSAFGKSAEFIEKWLHKGSKVAITGHLQSGSYTDKNGNKVNSVTIIVDQIDFCEAKGEAKDQVTEDAKSFLNVPDNLVEELPFS